MSINISCIEKKKGYVFLYFDNSNRIDILYSTFIEFYLYPGKLISEDELKSILLLNKKNEYLSKMVKYVSKHFSYSNKIESKLIKLGATKEDISYVISHLIDNHLLDDEEYSKEYLLSLSNKLIGRNKIYRLFKDKNLPISDIEDIEEVNKATILINKLISKPSKTSLKRYKDKIHAKLIRDGYDSYIVNPIINDLINIDEKTLLSNLNNDFKKSLSKYKKKYKGKELKEKVIKNLLYKGYNYTDINNIKELTKL